jgi:CRP-like cAMP-binding protein
MEKVQYADLFRGFSTKVAVPDDTVLLPDWEPRDWAALLDCAVIQPFRSSQVVIQRGSLDRSLYLVAEGALEVGITQVDGVSIAPLAKITAGSVAGEQSFFDGHARSANVWAVSDGTMLRIGFEEFREFGVSQPALARDILFALARVLSARLRNTTYRIRR